MNDPPNRSEDGRKDHRTHKSYGTTCKGDPARHTFLPLRCSRDKYACFSQSHHSRGNKEPEALASKLCHRVSLKNGLSPLSSRSRIRSHPQVLEDGFHTLYLELTRVRRREVRVVNCPGRGAMRRRENRLRRDDWPLADSVTKALRAECAPDWSGRRLGNDTNSHRNGC